MMIKHDAVKVGHSVYYLVLVFSIPPREQTWRWNPGTITYTHQTGHCPAPAAAACWSASPRHAARRKIFVKSGKNIFE